jgi:hypothetical protein
MPEAVDDAEFRDELKVELNGVPVQDWPRVGARPAESAPKKEWVDYAARLGLDRTYGKSMTVAELKAWVDGA